MNSSIQFLRYPLADQAVHIDFLRLRCGTEETFQEGIADVQKGTADAIHTFIAFSEWDAAIVVPSRELYPRSLTEIYANSKVASSVSGMSGYFAYLWEHPVNENWQARLANIEQSGPSILTSLRFAEWFRREVGLGAELLFCDFLQAALDSDRYRGIHAVVAHSLGWNDVILITHCNGNEERLTELLTDIRLTTLENCVGDKVDGFEAVPNSQIFAASYTHMLGGLAPYNKRELSLSGLSPLIESARMLVRVAPPDEKQVRKFLDRQRRKAKVKVVPSEMGHYSLSMDITEFTRSEGGKRALAFVAETRKFIGTLQKDPTGTKNEPDSYAETTTIFRFKDRAGQQHPAPPHIPIPKEVRNEIQIVERVMGELPHLLQHLGASSMTSHRFVSVLLTLLDHLSDPVRSSVVRHLSRFAKTIPDLVRELDPDGIDDLCHVLEYAVGQAIDGIAQFQHDANALGLSGRGGYSRLIVTVEWYVYSMYARLGVPARLPLITFGLRSGNAGSTRRYQIDIPFSVLFVPGRWHNLLHEVGHLTWQYTFSWMMESLAIYREMEREIHMEVQRDFWKGDRRLTDHEAKELAEDRVHVEFLRTREILRELFPSFLIFALPCAGDLRAMDALMLRRMMSLGHPSSVTRELLLAVVMRCLLELMDHALKEGAAADSKQGMTDIQRAVAWWGTWETLKDKRFDDEVRQAVHWLGETMDQLAKDTGTNFGMKKQALESPSLATAAAEALHSTVRALMLRGRHFRAQVPDHFAPMLFGRLLAKIAHMQNEQSHVGYQTWIGSQFAEWVRAGEIFPKHRDAFIWSRLLLASRAELIAGGRDLLMRSQLSVLLSMWHDAITDGPHQREKLERIITLGLIRPPDN
jgi:hypothetical protein